MPPWPDHTHTAERSADSREERAGLGYQHIHPLQATCDRGRLVTVLTFMVELAARSVLSLLCVASCWARHASISCLISSRLSLASESAFSAKQEVCACVWSDMSSDTLSMEHIITDKHEIQTMTCNTEINPTTLTNSRKYSTTTEYGRYSPLCFNRVS